MSLAVYILPSSLVLLHIYCTCFSTFWHCHPYILQHFNENVFTLCWFTHMRLQELLHKLASFWSAQCLCPKKFRKYNKEPRPWYFLRVVCHFYFVHVFEKRIHVGTKSVSVTVFSVTVFIDSVLLGFSQYPRSRSPSPVLARQRRTPAISLYRQHTTVSVQ